MQETTKDIIIEPNAKSEKVSDHTNQEHFGKKH